MLSPDATHSSGERCDREASGPSLRSGVYAARRSEGLSLRMT